MNKSSLHFQIHEWLVGEINSNPPGTILPTEKEIAQQFNASRTTVQNVMREFTRDGLIERVKGRGTFTAQNAKEIIHSPSPKHNGTIAMIYPGYPSIDYVLFSHIAEKQAALRKMDVHFYKTKPDTSTEQIYSWLNQEENLKGVILLSPGNKLTVEKLRPLDKNNIPIGLLGVFASPCLQIVDNIYVFSPNQTKSGYLTFTHLYQKGHQKVAYIANEPWTHENDHYLEGVTLARNEYRIDKKNLILSPHKVKPWDDSLAKSYQFTSEIISTHDISALVYPSFSGAIAGIRAIREAGKSVPEDYSIIVNASYDGSEDYFYPRLTTVTCTREAAMMEIFTTIFDLTSSKSREILIDVSINEQESVKPL